jgi:23S rRNA (uracil1939-C5)-methyltransferase
VADACGGCQFQFATAAGQRAAKQAALEEALARGAVRAAVKAWHEGPEFGWRTRVGLHAARGRSGLLDLGFHRERSRSVVPASTCLQVGDRLRGTIESLSRALRSGSGPAEAVSGLEVDVVESFDETERVVTLGPTADGAIGALPTLVSESVAGLSGVVVREGRSSRVEAGSPYLTHDVLGVRLRQHATSFFQGNRFLTERLAAAVIAQASAADVVDLYAGVGLFSVPLAAQGRRVRAVEWSASAVDDLRANASAARTSIDIVHGDVASTLEAVGRLDSAVVIVDPPRAGLSPSLPGVLADLGARRVVYVSCDPATLVRDIGRFQTRGFVVDVIEGFDLFPVTRHIETLAVLIRD